MSIEMKINSSKMYKEIRNSEGRIQARHRKAKSRLVKGTEKKNAIMASFNRQFNDKD
jgi:hypothetical protein